jgi:cobalt-zinc-cadmium efflux system membrane fusion protein
MSHKTKPTRIIIIILLLALAGTSGFFLGRRPAAVSPADAHAETGASSNISGAVHEHGEESHADGDVPAGTHHDEVGADGRQEQAKGDAHAEHSHGTGVSDLDRPLDEMWAARCEHNILQHECDECRYEIGTVKLDAQLLGADGLVRSGFPEKRQGRHEERSLSGEVQLDETRTVHVASPLTGLITRSSISQGTKVEAGSPLFEVDSPEVAEAKADYLKAVAGLDLARKAAEREARLYARKVAALVEVQEAEARRTEAETETAAARGRLLRLGLTKAEIEAISAQGGTAALDGLVVIRAARAGTVIEGHAAPGEHAEAGKELLTISDLGSVWVLADVKESELAAVTGVPGGEARIEALGRTFTGRLDTVSGRMSEETRTAKARFSVENSEVLLKPGMFVSVRVALPAPGEALVVPKVAVLADAGRTFVFTHKEGDFWVRRPVTLGARFDELVEITSGLTAEQRIITDGSFLLKSDVLRSKMGAGCAD